jgi:hypothetical protein
VIEELVPPSIRGKEIGKGLKIIGGYSVSSVLYEDVIIWDSQSGRTAVTISFKRSDCQ